MWLVVCIAHALYLYVLVLYVYTPLICVYVYVFNMYLCMYGMYMYVCIVFVGLVWTGLLTEVKMKMDAGSRAQAKPSFKFLA